MAAIAATGRKTAVLCGFETDVCVTHSAVGLMEAGYRVVVAVDAVYSPAGAQAFGLARLRDLGVELVHCKGIYYDWVRTLEAALAFEREHPDLAEPPGLLDLRRARADTQAGICGEGVSTGWLILASNHAKRAARRHGRRCSGKAATRAGSRTTSRR